MKTMKTTIDGIGAALLLIGIGAADSPSLIAPLVLIGIGALMLVNDEVTK